MGSVNAKKGLPFRRVPCSDLALCCLGLPIGPGTLLASIGVQLQPPKCGHHGRIGSMFRDLGPNLGTKRFELGRSEQSLVALLCR